MQIYENSISANFIRNDGDFYSPSAAITAQTRTDVYAVTNAKIVTVSGKIIERGTIVVRDGLIESVGETARVPADARVFDGAGLTVYPGFFDALTSLAFKPRRLRQIAAGKMRARRLNCFQFKLSGRFTDPKKRRLKN